MTKWALVSCVFYPESLWSSPKHYHSDYVHLALQLLSMQNVNFNISNMISKLPQHHICKEKTLRKQRIILKITILCSYCTDWNLPQKNRIYLYVFHTVGTHECVLTTNFDPQPGGEPSFLGPINPSTAGVCW